MKKTRFKRDGSIPRACRAPPLLPPPFFIFQGFFPNSAVLQELAYAIMYEKPICVLILDAAAWDMLTTPGGAAVAWGQPPVDDDAQASSSSASSQEQTPSPPRPALCTEGARGRELIPGTPLTLESIEQLFFILEAINFCPCRPLEETNLGWDGLLNNSVKYVKKELEYMKQHAELGNLARKWEARGKPHGLLLRKDEAYKWTEWCNVATTACLLPAVSELQLRFVTASMKAVERNRRLLVYTGICMLALVLAGGITSAIMAVRATQNSKLATSKTIEAETNLALATVKTSEAETNLAMAESSATQARQEAQRASEATLVALSSSAISAALSSAQANDAAGAPVAVWELAVADLAIGAAANQTSVQSGQSFSRNDIMDLVRMGLSRGFLQTLVGPTSQVRKYAIS